MERHGRPERPESLNDHFVIAFDGDIANYAAARWLRSVAPRAKIAARSDSWPAFIATVKTGVGIGPLPIHRGDREEGLIRLFDTAPDLVSEFWLLMHPDMRQRHGRAYSSIILSPNFELSERYYCDRMKSRKPAFPRQHR